MLRGREANKEKHTLLTVEVIFRHQIMNIFIFCHLSRQIRLFSGTILYLPSRAASGENILFVKEEVTIRHPNTPRVYNI